MFYGAIYLFIELDIFKSRLTFCPDKSHIKFDVSFPVNVLIL